MIRSNVTATLIHICILLFAVGCQWEKRTEPSVLVLAVESLPFETVNCDFANDQGSQDNGFQVLCAESVRFSHAYTPSALSQPAIISLLSGLWPFQHGVRDNGASAVSAKVAMAAEVAFDKGYRTSFFSGGAPIFRKSGIAQGFELFEDTLPMKHDKIARNFNESVRLFRQWYNSEVNGKKFFSVLYVPDLQIFDEPTLDEKGRIVERTYGGRVKRLQSAMIELFDFLKKENQWNNTYLVLAGLNGYSDQERFNEIPSTNLHIENTQVALIVKPPQKDRDLGINWKIDYNVTLIDAGKTLLEILGSPPTPEKESGFSAVSLLPALQSAKPTWAPDRIFPVESGWAKWKGFGANRFALRAGTHLLAFDEVPKFYNTLTDRLELNPVKPGPEWDERVTLAKTILGVQDWTGIPQQVLHEVDVAINIWDPTGRAGVIQQENEKDPIIAGWLATRSIEGKNWSQLQRLAKLHKNRFWEALAESFVSGKTVFPESTCIRWARKTIFDPVAAKECGDLMFKNLVGWIKNDQNGSEATPFREAFVKNYRNLMLDRRISQLNYVNGLCWDVGTSSTQGPVLSEVYLNYPENKKYWAQLQDRLKIESSDGGIF